MPGIPWTSKGCNTCRRRKVGCDQKRPACDRCIKTGRDCEGYDRPDKKSRVSRTKSDAGSITSSTTPSQTTSPASSHDASLVPIANFSPIAFPAELDASDIADYQLVNAFLEAFFPKQPIPWLNSDHIWMITASQLQEPGNALRLALRAVAMSRMAWKTSNSELTTAAQTHYIGGLSEFQKALWDPAERREDRTLAAGRALTLYEIYESTSFKGWNSHSKGYASLLQMRGPETLQSTFARQLTESYRSTGMFQCIQNREASFLTLPEWSAHTYDASNILQQLYDTGLELAAFLQDVDRHSGSTANLMSMMWQTLLSRCIDFDRRLERWWARLIMEQKSLPMYWETAASKSYVNMGDIDHLGNLAPLEFQNVYLAHAILNFWALKGIVCSLAGMMCQKTSYPDMSWAAEPGRPSSTHEILRHLPDKFACQEAADKICHRLALQIVRSLYYCNRDEHGMVGAQRVLFSSRMALSALRTLKAPEMEACEQLYVKLMTERGVGYAMQMKEIPGSQWDKIEKSRNLPSANSRFGM